MPGTSRIPVNGGPADGLEVAQGEGFVWLEVQVVKRKKRTENAGLYRLVNGAYEYEGGHTSKCLGCGAFFERLDMGGERQPCPLCGHEHEAAAA